MNATKETYFEDAYAEQMKLLDVTEELHSALVPFLKETRIGTILDHPFLRYPYIPKMNAIINHSYKKIKTASSQALDDKDYDSYFSWIQKEWRLRVFADIVAPLLDPKTYYKMLADQWMHCENIWQYQELLRDLLDEYPEYQKYMMSRYARAKLACLPETIRIYRGATERNKRSLSWTLSKKVAQFFVDRYNIDKYQGISSQVYTATCEKKHVIALLLTRREQEVIVDPELLTFCN
jgi:hypothetical protein